MAWSDEVHFRRTKAAVARARRQAKGYTVDDETKMELVPLCVLIGSVTTASLLRTLGPRVKGQALRPLHWLKQQWRTHVLRQGRGTPGGRSRSEKPASAREAAAQAAVKRSQQGSESRSPFTFDRPDAAEGSKPSSKKKKRKGKGKSRGN